MIDLRPVAEAELTERGSLGSYATTFSDPLQPLFDAGLTPGLWTRFAAGPWRCAAQTCPTGRRSSAADGRST